MHSALLLVEREMIDREHAVHSYEPQHRVLHSAIAEEVHERARLSEAGCVISRLKRGAFVFCLQEEAFSRFVHHQVRYPHLIDVDCEVIDAAEVARGSHERRRSFHI